MPSFALADKEPQEVVLHFRAERAKYVETKKIHPTQEITWLANSRLEVRLLVELNRKPEARILEFGKDVVVIEPTALRKRIKDNLYEALTMY